MQSFYTEFMRSTPDNWKLQHFSIPHIMITLAVICCAMLLWKKREQLTKKSAIKILLVTMLTIQVFLLYYWYITTGYSGLNESLPLYNCRVAILFTIAALLTENKIAKNIACYWGLGGGIIAILLPNMDPFSWPHVTQLSFFMGHFALLLSSLYIFMTDNMTFNKKSLINILIFSTTFHILVALLNFRMKSNYCMVYQFPFGELPFVENATIYYAFFAISMHNFFLFLIHLSLRYLEKKRDASVKPSSSR